MGTKILQTDLARDALYTKVNTIADEKQDVLTFDSTPTSGSNNPVTSGGIKTYVDSGLSPKAEDNEVVHNSGDETIAGTKTFSTSPVVPTPSVSSNTTVPATTAYVNNKFQVVSSLPANPDPNTFYFVTGA